MPFVVPQQQQPERQKSTSMPSDHREQAPQPQYQQRPYRQSQQQQSPWQQARQPQQQYRYQPAPQPQRQYRQPQPYRDPYGQRGGGRQYQQPMPYSTRQQRGYEQGRQQMPAQGSEEYNRYDPRARAEMDSQRSYQQQYGNMNGYRSTYDQPQQGGRAGYAQQQAQIYSSRPQQGTYVGEGVYADGTPMPPVSSSGYSGQSLIQSNAGPAGGVYSGFNQTPEVNGGDIVPRPYFEEDDVYNKPMRTGRGQGGIR